MNIEFLDTKKRKKILEQLNKQFGIEKIPSILFSTGREKIRAFSGDLTIDELYDLADIGNVEFMGQYLFKHEFDFIRLGFDGALLLKNQLTKNVIELDKEQTDLWMNGHNLPIIMPKGIYVLRHGDDVFGCGISDGKHIINFVPKERRIRRS